MNNRSEMVPARYLAMRERSITQMRTSRLLSRNQPLTLIRASHRSMQPMWLLSTDSTVNHLLPRE